VYFIIAFRQTGVIQGSAQNACKNRENKPKVLDFCTLAVYDNHISGQLNIVCHLRMKSVMMANVYDQ
jgi:hypothetical protein